jgi:hypothetical protein
MTVMPRKAAGGGGVHNGYFININKTSFTPGGNELDDSLSLK